MPTLLMQKVPSHTSSAQVCTSCCLTSAQFEVCISDMWCCTEPCNDDDLVLVDGYCRYCGASDQPCCAEDTCDGYSLYCRDGKCAECGQKGGRMCYEGEACEAGLVPYVDEICSCGGQWQNCCDGSCNSDGEQSLACDPSNSEYGQCQPCGGEIHFSVQNVHAV